MGILLPAHVLVSLIGIAAGIVVLFWLFPCEQTRWLDSAVPGNHGRHQRLGFSVSHSRRHTRHCHRGDLTGDSRDCCHGQRQRRDQRSLESQRRQEMTRQSRKPSDAPRVIEGQAVRQVPGIVPIGGGSIETLPQTGGTERQRTGKVRPETRGCDAFQIAPEGDPDAYRVAATTGFHSAASFRARAASSVLSCADNACALRSAFFSFCFAASVDQK